MIRRGSDNAREEREGRKMFKKIRKEHKINEMRSEAGK